MSTKPRTLFEKIWDNHVVFEEPGRQTILYIDLHLVHEVTSPQAFEGLRLTGRKLRRPELTLSTVDHNVPTTDRSLPILDPISKQQIDTLRNNCNEFGITLYDIHDPRQGIVHVIGPEQGYTQPGMTIVCGDSHTSTHGAFGALAFGIGTSEVEHVLATQTLLQSKAKTLELRVDGKLGPGVTAKDVILYLIGQISTSGGVGYCVEYTGRSRAIILDGKPDDGLQHVHRGRSAGRASSRRTISRTNICVAVPMLRKARSLMQQLPNGESCRPISVPNTTSHCCSTVRKSRPKFLGERIRARLLR